MVVIRKKPSILLFGGLWAPNRCEHLTEFLVTSGYYVAGVFTDFYVTRKHHRNVFTRAINKLTFKVFPLVELFFKASFADVIYILPSNVGLINQALMVSKIFKNKIILELYDSMYTHYMENAGSDSIDKKDIERVKKDNVDLDPKNEKVAIKEADYIIHIASYELDFLSKALDISIPRDKIFIAPIFCAPRPQHQRVFKSDGIFRICWWGSFLPLHGLDYILQALQQLKQDGIAFECDLFGAYSAGSRAYFFKKYQQKIAQEKLDSHVRLRRDLTFSDGKLSDYLIQNCDLALGVFGETLKAESSIPNKLIEALSMGIPTLTRSSPALEEFFEVDTDLWTCQPSPEAIANALLQIYHQNAYPVDWSKTQKKVSTQFSVENYKSVVENVLQQVRCEF